MGQPLGFVVFPIKIKTKIHIATAMSDFLVVKVLYSSNSTIGKLMLNNLKIMISTYHLKITSPAEFNRGHDMS